MLQILKLKVAKIQEIRLTKNRPNYPYPKALKKEVLDYINLETESSYAICRYLGINHTVITRWKTTIKKELE